MFLKKYFIVISLVISSYIFAQEAKSKVAIVVSVYHESITEKLLDAATQCLYQNGLQPEDISIAYVPGSFEIPYTVKLLAETKRFDAIICLGALITSNNSDWTYIADHVLKNIAQVSLIFDIPVTWGMFLFDDKEQAQEAANNFETNRGWEAAQAAIRMIGLTKQIMQFAQTEPLA